MEFSDATEELIYVGIHFSHTCWQGIFVSVGKGIHSVFGYPALGVEGGQRDLVQVLPVDVVLL